MTAHSLWSVREQDFPVSAGRRQQLRFTLNYAVLAPSSHNTQPWRFHILNGGEGVDLWMDRTRSLPVADPDDRELTISCGAALLQLRLAMENFGPQTFTELLPDPSQPNWAARITWERRPIDRRPDRPLFTNIVWRHTDRNPFQDWTVPPALLTELEHQARQEGAWLRFLLPGQPRESVAALIAEGVRRQAASPPFRQELARWLRPNWQEASDGIPGYSLGMRGWTSSTIAPLLLRAVNWGRWMGKAEAESARRAPVLAVLGTLSDDPKAWLNAGQALTRVLLRSCAEGVRASFLNQPVQVPELRSELAAITQAGVPQMMFRLGYGFHSKPTPRRPVDCVVS